MFTLAHLSDPHLSGWPLPQPGELLSKRIFGFLSWQLRRRFVHRQSVLDRVVAQNLFRRRRQASEACRRSLVSSLGESSISFNRYQYEIYFRE